MTSHGKHKQQNQNPKFGINQKKDQNYHNYQKDLKIVNHVLKRRLWCLKY